MQEQEKIAMDRYLAQEREHILQHVPALANEEDAAATGRRWFKTLNEFGFTKEEFANVTDHRMLRVVHALTEAQDELSRIKGRKKPVRRRRVKSSVRPNARTANTRSDERARRQQAVERTARETGKVDDVAAFLIRPASET